MPDEHDVPPPVAPSPADVVITWVGHATVLVEHAGHRVLTDPALTGRLAHLRRRTAVPQLPPVDSVLVSHLHMDHLHLPSLRKVVRDELIVPLGAGAVMPRGASGVHEVEPGDQLLLAATEGTFDVQVVHAEHLHRRGPHTRARAHPVGYLIHVGGRTIYFPGDTDLFDGMRSLGTVDVALLPIWGWGPTLGERHLTPATAAVAAGWVRSTLVAPIHWGTYSPVSMRRGAPSWLHDPLSAFRSELDQLGLASVLHDWHPGGRLVLPAATTP